MDPESFLDLANQVTKLKMYPYFDLAHAALCCLAVRDDLANGRTVLSRSMITTDQSHCRITALLQEASSITLGILHVGHLCWRNPRKPAPWRTGSSTFEK